jgi:hypothetical protein
MVKLVPGQAIEYLVDVGSPPNQKGIRGQTKIIGRNIPMWTAKFLLRGGQIRPYDPDSPLQLEEEKPGKKKKGPDGPAESPGPASIKVKTERRTSNDGQRKTNNEANQTGDPGPEKPGPERRKGNRRD